MQQQSWKKPDMPVTLQGIRIDSVSIKHGSAESESNPSDPLTMEGQYSLVSNTGKTLAKQPFNGYQGVKVNPSPETQRALINFVESLQKDVEKQLGFGE